MKLDEREYIRHRLARAEDTIGEAETLLNAGFSVGVVNRLYYACFYAVSALLLSEGHAASKHSGVISLFDKHWIKPKRLNPEMSKFYHLLFDNRQKGDYADVFTFDHSDLTSWLNETKIFVNTLSNWLINNIDLHMD
ncbi:HEPN domain-containing protein [bacterium]|nr:HEPN domain-containing protein [bacterium]